MKTCKLEVTSRFLKDLAIITMVINHVCDTFMAACGYDGFWYEFQECATRISFILFAFMISEGMYKTHDRSKYLFRLGLLALISEVPYDFCFNGQFIVLNNYNIFFTLFLGALAIDLMEKYDELWKKLVILIVFCVVGFYQEAGFIGIMIIVIFYFLRQKPLLMYGSIALLLLFDEMIFGLFTVLPVMDYDLGLYFSAFSWTTIGRYEQLFGVLAFPFIALYKGKKGNSKMPAWFFYAFYPAHLIIIGVLVKLIYG